MRYLNGVLGIVLVAFALTHLGEGVVWTAAYGLAGLAALASLKRELNAWTIRLLAVTATLAMFVFFGGFFARAPYLVSNWYEMEGAARAVLLLVAAFLMMPVVADYSCRMQSKCLHRADHSPSHST